MSFRQSKILIVCPIGLGNYLMVCPSVYQLTQACPEAELHLLSLKPVITQLAQKNPHLSKVINFNADQPGMKDIWQLITTLRLEKYDASFTFFPSNNWRYNLIPFVSCIPKRFAFSYRTAKFTSLSIFQNRKIDVSETMGDVEQNLNLVAYASGTEEPQNITIDFPAVNQTGALAYLRHHDLLGKNLVGIHPGSSKARGMIHKRWPAEKFAILAKLLTKRNHFHVLVFGEEEEKALKAQVVRGNAEATCVESMDIFKTAGLIQQCRHFVSNDSGLMHVAAAVGTSCTAIFGPSDEQRTAPWGNGHTIISKSRDCRPCWRIDNVGSRKDCPDNGISCLKDLKVEAVYKGIRIDSDAKPPRVKGK